MFHRRRDSLCALMGCEHCIVSTNNLHRKMENEHLRRRRCEASTDVIATLTSETLVRSVLQADSGSLQMVLCFRTAGAAASWDGIYSA